MESLNVEEKLWIYRLISISKQILGQV